jgi:hypothetical protein
MNSLDFFKTQLFHITRNMEMTTKVPYTTINITMERSVDGHLFFRKTKALWLKAGAVGVIEFRPPPLKNRKNRDGTS